MKGRILIIQDKLTRLQTSPPDPASKDAVERDPEVFKRNLLVMASRDLWQVWAGSGSPQAPAVRKMEQNYRELAAGLEKMKAEKLAALESSRKVSEARPLAALSSFSF